MVGLKRTRIRPKNARRAKLARTDDFGSSARMASIASMRCVCMGQHPACSGGWSEPSHIVSRGAGGDAGDIVPMSTGCHRAWHTEGRWTWLSRAGLTWEQLRAAADALVGEQDDGAPW